MQVGELLGINRQNSASEGGYVQGQLRGPSRDAQDQLARVLRRSAPDEAAALDGLSLASQGAR